MVKMINGMEQALTVKISMDKIVLFCTFVYAKWNRNDRRQLWDYIEQQDFDKENWIIGGDFNCILKANEKSGGNAPCMNSIADFNTCLVDNSLSELNHKGNPFTWSNNQQGKSRIWEKLDRILMNSNAFNNLPDMEVLHLPRVYSDHAPLWLKVAAPPDIRKRFRFQQMWTEHTEYKGVVAKIWKDKIPGHIGYVVNEKLKRVRMALKKWNWDSFGDINKNIINLNNQINTLENKLQLQWDDNTHREISQLQEQLHHNVRWEADLLKQKSRINWLQDGDRNTKFFHAVIKDRRKRNLISIKDDNGCDITDHQAVGEKAAEFYKSLFTATDYYMDVSLFENIPNLINADDNYFFEKIPDAEEVYQAESLLFVPFLGPLFVSIWPKTTINHPWSFSRVPHQDTRPSETLARPNEATKQQKLHKYKSFDRMKLKNTPFDRMVTWQEEDEKEAPFDRMGPFDRTNPFDRMDPSNETQQSAPKANAPCFFFLGLKNCLLGRIFCNKLIHLAKQNPLIFNYK
ncbi:hypothetical protein CASFOL_037892 [Castilleja foliolosa]|uniref:Reverse transcriptase n=1 Tax=Castilleja foliolosa TaxID=1961234 RepID=A0ABD3BJE9_9LAMI